MLCIVSFKISFLHHSSGFPGCQPVSMDLNNINLLHQKPYRVSWKADGTRYENIDIYLLLELLDVHLACYSYMMLIDGEDEVYFFDRDHNVFKVHGLTFPQRKDLGRHLKDTLLDGVSVDFENITCSEVK